MREQICRRLDEIAARGEVKDLFGALGPFGMCRPKGEQRFAGLDATDVEAKRRARGVMRGELDRRTGQAARP